MLICVISGNAKLPAQKLCYYTISSPTLSSSAKSGFLSYEFRRERKPDFAEEESVGLLKALRRGRRDYQGAVWRIELGLLPLFTSE